MSGAARTPRTPRLADRVVWIDGRLCRGAEAVLSLFDRGARDGEGLFETVRIEGRRPLDWERHLERLVLSAAELGFPVPPAPERLARALRELLEAAPLTEAVARITVTRGIPGGRPTRAGAWIEIEPLESRLWSGARSGRASAIVSRTPFAPGALGKHKTTSRLAYHLAREEARAARADEALLASAQGEMLEGAASSLFVVLDGIIATTPLERGILPGIARATVLRLCARLGIAAGERLIMRADLARAEEAFVTNCVQEVVPLVEIDGRKLPHTRLGAQLRQHYREALSSRR